jgi:Protein tyrosine and serine/threonine kinase
MQASGLFSTGTRQWLKSYSEDSDDADIFSQGRGLHHPHLASELRTDISSHTVHIDFTEVSLKTEIGAGGNATVFKGDWRGSTVAVKKLRGSLSSETIRGWVREVRINAALQHPNVMMLYGVCVALPDLLLVCELAERGSLFDVLQEAGDDMRKLPMRRRLRMAQGCAGLLFNRFLCEHQKMLTPTLFSWPGLYAQPRTPLGPYRLEKLELSRDEKLDRKIGRLWRGPRRLFGGCVRKFNKQQHKLRGANSYP